jgi:hypothetical protein
MIIYRTPGPWGPGKGSNLTEVEVDGNFHELTTRVDDIIANPPEAVGIDHFVIEGSLMTVVMTDGSEHGPFVLPVAQWRWTGPWQPVTQYFVGDILTDSGNVYFVRVQHVSELTFDPGLFGPDGEVYVLILAASEQPYDIGMFYNGRIIAGSEIIMLHVAARPFTLPGTLAGSVAALIVAPSATEINLPILVNGTVVGTLTFAIGETDGTFAPIGGIPPQFIELGVADRLWITLPPEDDSTAAGLAVTIIASTGGTGALPSP